jgi:hypothetical protein
MTKTTNHDDGLSCRLTLEGTVISILERVFLVSLGYGLAKRPFKLDGLAKRPFKLDSVTQSLVGTAVLWGVYTWLHCPIACGGMSERTITN